MAIYSFEGKRPEIHPTAYIHPQATIIGDVTIGANCYVGAGARIRGDWGRIVVGAGTNIQENVVIHSPAEFSVIIGQNCHVGHSAIVHGAKLGERVTIGMGAILQDDVEIGDDVIVGSGALVVEGTKIPSGKVAVGLPARVVGDVSPEQRAEFAKGIDQYQALPARMREGLKEV